jgi:penicillin-binding protein 2
VVNEDGGTGGRARLKNVVVAGKTGTAQAMTGGKKDTIGWFACFAPYDQPRYTVAVMVQGGEHGGSVAAPIADRILERALAMEEGKFDMQVAWMGPAHKQNPFQMVKDVSFQDAGPNVANADEENAKEEQNGDVQMARAAAEPDVELEADQQGQVAKKRTAPRAQQVSNQPQRKPNFFERLFGAKPRPAPTPPPPARRRFSN